MRSITLVAGILTCFVFILDLSRGYPYGHEPGYVRRIDQDEYYVRSPQRKRESPTMRRYPERSPRIGRSGFPEEYYRQRVVRPEDQTFHDITDSSMYKPSRQGMKSPMNHDYKIKKQRYRIYRPDFGKYGDDHWQDDVVLRRQDSWRQSRRIKGPHRKRENSLDRMVDGETVIIRYVPKMKNDIDMPIYNDNEDRSVSQTYYDEQPDHLVRVSQNDPCPYCKDKHHHRHHHHHNDEDNTESYPFYYQSPVPLEDHINVESTYFKPTTTDSTRMERPFTSHKRHYTDFHGIPEGHVSEEVKFEATSPVIDSQHPEKRGKQLEFIMSSDGTENVPTTDRGIIKLVSHDARESDVSEDQINGNFQPLMEAEKDVLNNSSTDIIDTFTKSEMSTEENME